MLRGVLAGQKKFQEAEPLLVEGYSGMKARAAKIPPAAQPRLNCGIRGLFDLYDAAAGVIERDPYNRSRRLREFYTVPSTTGVNRDELPRTLSVSNSCQFVNQHGGPKSGVERLARFHFCIRAG